MFHLWFIQLKVAVGEFGKAEAVTKNEERIIGTINITGTVLLLGAFRIIRTAGILFAEKNRHLTNITGESDRKFTRGIDFSGKHICNSNLPP